MAIELYTQASKGSPLVHVYEYVNARIPDSSIEILHHAWSVGAACSCYGCASTRGPARPVYLQRLLGLQHAGEAFERFDAAVTEKVLDILAMESPGDVSVRTRVQ